MNISTRPPGRSSVYVLKVDSPGHVALHRGAIICRILNGRSRSGDRIRLSVEDLNVRIITNDRELLRYLEIKVIHRC